MRVKWRAGFCSFTDSMRALLPSAFVAEGRITPSTTALCPPAASSMLSAVYALCLIMATISGVFLGSGAG